MQNHPGGSGPPGLLGSCADTPLNIALLGPALLHKYELRDIVTCFKIGATSVDFFASVAEVAAEGRVNRADRVAMQHQNVQQSKRAKP